jgi:2-hydroxy-3-keto-5-methylthiopentenyl-1-phosphate phosphatase
MTAEGRMSAQPPSGRTAPLAAGDLILCDFDGTISVEDVGLAAINALGDQRAWDLEYRWRRGEIDSRECLAGQWGLIDWPLDRLLALFDSIGLDEGFHALWRLVLDRAARLVILSDGLDLYLDRMMSRLGYRTCDGLLALSDNFGACVPRFANRAEYRDGPSTGSGPGGRLELFFPCASDFCDQCGNCKLAHLMLLRPSFRRTLYIGDAYSDVCPAKYADVVFAKSHLADIFADERLPFVRFDELADVAAILGGENGGGV